MTLEAYLKRPDAMNLTQLASAIGISKGRMTQLRQNGDWTPELALKVEAETGGAINASLLNATIARARQTGAAA